MCPRLCGYKEDLGKVMEEIEMEPSELGAEKFDEIDNQNDSDLDPAGPGIYAIDDHGNYDPKATINRQPRVVKQRRSINSREKA